MGVVRKRVVVEYPHENGNDQEAGNPQSDAETASTSEPAPVYYPRRRQRNRTYRVVIIEDSSSPSSNSGKRKVRRYANAKTLEIYLKDDEEGDDNLLEYYKGPFARLMDITEEPLEYMDEICSQLEQEKVATKNKEEKRTNASAYMRISNKIRRTIKIKKNFPLNLMKELENEILDFFKATPLEIYCIVPSKSFERLLYHAISQYHRLNSVSLMKESSISVEVFNDDEGWAPEAVPLSDYVVAKNIVVC